MTKDDAKLTSTIILQLLQAPIWPNNSKMRASVTSLERFPTYLDTRKKEMDRRHMISTVTLIIKFKFLALGVVIFNNKILHSYRTFIIILSAHVSSLLEIKSCWCHDEMGYVENKRRHTNTNNTQADTSATNM